MAAASQRHGASSMEAEIATRMPAVVLVPDFLKVPPYETAPPPQPNHPCPPPWSCTPILNSKQGSCSVSSLLQRNVSMLYGHGFEDVIVVARQECLPYVSRNLANCRFRRSGSKSGGRSTKKPQFIELSPKCVCVGDAMRELANFNEIRRIRHEFLFIFADVICDPGALAELLTITKQFTNRNAGFGMVRLLSQVPWVSRKTGIWKPDQASFRLLHPSFDRGAFKVNPETGELFGLVKSAEVEESMIYVDVNQISRKSSSASAATPSVSIIGCCLESGIDVCSARILELFQEHFDCQHIRPDFIENATCDSFPLEKLGYCLPKRQLDSPLPPSFRCVNESVLAAILELAMCGVGKSGDFPLPPGFVGSPLDLILATLDQKSTTSSSIIPESEYEAGAPLPPTEEAFVALDEPKLLVRVPAGAPPGLPTALVEEAVRQGGGFCWICGPCITLDRSATVSNSFVGNNVTIGPKSRVARSVLMENASVGANLTLKKCFLHRGANVTTNEASANLLLQSVTLGPEVSVAEAPEAGRIFSVESDCPTTEAQSTESAISDDSGAPVFPATTQQVLLRSLRGGIRISAPIPIDERIRPPRCPNFSEDDEGDTGISDTSSCSATAEASSGSDSEVSTCSKPQPTAVRLEEPRRHRIFLSTLDDDIYRSTRLRKFQREVFKASVRLFTYPKEDKSIRAIEVTSLRLSLNQNPLAIVEPLCMGLTAALGKLLGSDAATVSEPTELVRRVSATHFEETFREFFPKAQSNPEEQRLLIESLLRQSTDWGPELPHFNNWALGADDKRDGGPILADEPVGNVLAIEPVFQNVIATLLECEVIEWDELQSWLKAYRLGKRPKQVTIEAFGISTDNPLRSANSYVQCMESALSLFE